jgi:hypothetical protein
MVSIQYSVFNVLYIRTIVQRHFVFFFWRLEQYSKCIIVIPCVCKYSWWVGYVKNFSMLLSSVKQLFNWPFWVVNQLYDCGYGINFVAVTLRAGLEKLAEV